jgi:hypothetical protein
VERLYRVPRETYSFPDQDKKINAGGAEQFDVKRKAKESITMIFTERIQVFERLVAVRSLVLL